MVLEQFIVQMLRNVIYNKAAFYFTELMTNLHQTMHSTVNFCVAVTFIKVLKTLVAIFCSYRSNQHLANR